MRISDWSSDVCSSDLRWPGTSSQFGLCAGSLRQGSIHILGSWRETAAVRSPSRNQWRIVQNRSEEHTSELQSLMRISYAVFCLKKKNINMINKQPKL